jgi:hypothetical protein
LTPAGGAAKKTKRRTRVGAAAAAAAAGAGGTRAALTAEQVTHGPDPGVSVYMPVGQAWQPVAPERD